MRADRWLGSLLTTLLVATALGGASATLGQSSDQSSDPSQPRLLWQPLPDLPDSPGVAGAFVGISGGALVVAGGTNWTEPVWEGEKKWHDRVQVLTRRNHRYEWHDGGKLPRPLAGGATVNLSEGMLCIGGCDERQAYADVFLMRWDPGSEQMTIDEYPALPKPVCYTQAAVAATGPRIYVIGGQSTTSLESAHAEVYRLDLGKRKSPDEFKWERLEDFPGGPRAHHVVVAQGGWGSHTVMHVMGGRRVEEGKTRFLSDTWRLLNGRNWNRRADMPRPAAAAPAVARDAGDIYLLGGDDGSLFDKTDELRDEHPGFPRDVLIYDVDRDSWESTGELPTGQLATGATVWEGRIIVASGEIRPRVRTPKVWALRDRGSSQPNR